MERYERQLERTREREDPELEQGYDLASESRDMIAASKELAIEETMAERTQERADTRGEEH